MPAESRGHHDPDERDVLTPLRCSECEFLILGEQPVLGIYGWVHARCVEES